MLRAPELLSRGHRRSGRGRYTSHSGRRRKRDVALACWLHKFFVTDLVRRLAVVLGQLTNGGHILLLLLSPLLSFAARCNTYDRTIQRRLARYAVQGGVQATAHRLRHTLATRLINQGMPVHSLRKLLGHQYLNTTQVYARIYDETLHEQFRTAVSHLEAITVDDWPDVDVGEPAFVQN